MTLYEGYEFPERTMEDIIRSNAISRGQDPDEAWENYKKERALDRLGELGNDRVADRYYLED